MTISTGKDNVKKNGKDGGGYVLAVAPAGCFLASRRSYNVSFHASPPQIALLTGPQGSTAICITARIAPRVHVVQIIEMAREREKRKC